MDRSHRGVRDKRTPLHTIICQTLRLFQDCHWTRRIRGRPESLRLFHKYRINVTKMLHVTIYILCGLRVASFVSVFVHTLHVVDVAPEIIDKSFSFGSARLVRVPALRDTAGLTDTDVEVLQTLGFLHEVFTSSCTVDEIHEAFTNWRWLVVFSHNGDSHGEQNDEELHDEGWWW